MTSVERAALRAERSWWRSHALNGPSPRAVAEHAWPFLAVAMMLAWAGFWWGLALPLAAVAAIMLVSWATTRRP